MIPVSEPALGSKEIELVSQCIKTGWISSEGKYVKEFEKKWAAYCGRKYGVAVTSGTVALETAVWSLHIEHGSEVSEVIMPTFTIISCAIAIVRNGLIPVLIDCDPDTWCMNVDAIEDKITPRTKAIMAVHIYGTMSEMDKILELAQKYSLFVIEDAAEAHGATYKGKLAGRFGDISCFSFYANKIVTTGEGGMVVTDNKNLADRCRSYRNLCFNDEKRFYHTELGSNYRMTNVQAAIGVSQLYRIDKIIAKKKWIGKTYMKSLHKIDSIQLQRIHSWIDSTFWMFPILIKGDHKYNARILEKMLLQKGIQTRPFFLGMHDQPVFKNMGMFKSESFPVADEIYRKGLYLPSGLSITREQIDYVSECLNEIFHT